MSIIALMFSQNSKLLPLSNSCHLQYTKQSVAFLLDCISTRLHIYHSLDPRGPFYLHGLTLTLIPASISNYSRYKSVWREYWVIPTLQRPTYSMVWGYVGYTVPAYPLMHYYNPIMYYPRYCPSMCMCSAVDYIYQLCRVFRCNTMPRIIWSRNFIPHRACDYLSTLKLKLNHVNKRAPCFMQFYCFVLVSFTIATILKSMQGIIHKLISYQALASSMRDACHGNEYLVRSVIRTIGMKLNTKLKFVLHPS